MQLRQKKYKSARYITAWSIALYLGFATPLVYNIGTNIDISDIYASELTDYVDSDHNMTKTDATDLESSFAETQDSNDDMAQAIIKKQNLKPEIESAYTEINEKASQGEIDMQNAETQQKIYEASIANQNDHSTENSDSPNYENANFDYSTEASEPLDSHITSTGGTCNGPSGKETYYNLPMDGVVQIMRNNGYSETNGWNYWVRNDGVKMFGKYVMVAADLDIRPRGSIIESSVGTAIVCDTGDFIKQNNKQLDIAVAW